MTMSEMIVIQWWLSISSSSPTQGSTAIRLLVQFLSLKISPSLSIPVIVVFLSDLMALVRPPSVVLFSISILSISIVKFLLNFKTKGKTTILKILGGKHMVEPDMVRVLGRSAFHDTSLTSSGDLAYLGGEVHYFCFSFNWDFHSILAQKQSNLEKLD